MPQHTEFALLDTTTLDENTTFAHPERLPELVHMDSPAWHVFTDFKLKEPAKTSIDVLVQKALEEMKHLNVKSLLVTDDHEHILGLISTRDIQGVKAGIAARDNGVKLTEVTVKMVMTPFEQLHVLDYKDLSNARVGHIVRLIHEKGLQHLLVVEPNREGLQIVRGIFSASRISRQLGTDVSGDLSSHSVADINKRIQ